MEMRRRSAGAVVASIVSCTASATFAQRDAAPEDVRQLVEMPPLAQAIVREEMPDNLGALNELIGLLAEDRLQAEPINIDPENLSCTTKTRRTRSKTRTLSSCPGSPPG